MSTTTDLIKKLRIFVQNHIRGTVPGDAVASFFKSLGVNDLFTCILYSQDRKEPTPGMQNAEKYFGKHQKDIETVASLLADDLSREVYFSAIKYRCTHNPKDAPVYSKHDQYFVKDFIALTDAEVFVDCGAYDGDTMKEFLKITKGRYQHIICFEPVEKYHTRLIKRSKNASVTAIRAGVYKESATLNFNDSGGKGSAITNTAEHTVSVPVRAIDDVPECADATFIKMDVEGAELDALHGAKETIVRNHPKLAICIYHYHRDFVEIPNYILSLVPTYQLYIRHHSFSINETVLYAIPKQKI